MTLTLALWVSKNPTLYTSETRYEAFRVLLAAVENKHELHREAEAGAKRIWHAAASRAPTKV